MDPLPDKPKWMRWATYDRAIAKIERLEHVHFSRPLAAILERIERMLR